MRRALCFSSATCATRWLEDVQSHVWLTCGFRGQPRGRRVPGTGNGSAVLSSKVAASGVWTQFPPPFSLPPELERRARGVLVMAMHFVASLWCPRSPSLLTTRRPSPDTCLPMLLNSCHNSFGQMPPKSHFENEEGESGDVQHCAQGSEFRKWPKQGLSPGRLAPRLGAQLSHVGERKAVMTHLGSLEQCLERQRNKGAAGATSGFTRTVWL